MAKVEIGGVPIGGGAELAVIVGPCVIESEEAVMRSAEAMQDICGRHGVAAIFCSSYDKANRTSIHSFRGPGLEEGLRILERVRDELGMPINTDVHTPEQARAAGDVCDSIQIPAFLCRQTDLVVAAAKTGKPVLVKKGQFMAPWDMKPVVEKIRESGNEKIILMDRGTSFGYNNLVSDFRSLPVMRELGCPVCFDGTHSVQLPGGLGATTGGQRQFIAPLCRAAVAVGTDCLYLEAHPDPARAKSDAGSQLSHEQLDELLPSLKALQNSLCLSGR